MYRKLIFSFGLLCLFTLPYSASAQVGVAEIIKAGVKKVIVAIDLKVQRLQNKTIWLQNAQKVVENTLSKTRLKEIGSWVKKQKDQYAQYFESLKKVKAILNNYHEIKAVIEQQKALISAYHQAWNHLQGDPHFRTEEVLYMSQVYTGMLHHSLQNLNDLLMVLRSNQTQMSDGQRLNRIHRLSQNCQQNYLDLLKFNQQNFMLSLNRAHDQQDLAQIKLWYHLK